MRADLGVAFRLAGPVIATTDILYINVQVPIPGPLPFSTSPTHCARNDTRCQLLVNKPTDHFISDEHQLTVNNLLYIQAVNDTINTHIRNIRTALTTSTLVADPLARAHGTRSKRFAPLIPLVVSGLFSAGKLGLDIWRATRTNSLHRTVSQLAAGQQAIYKHITAFEGKQILFNEQTNNKFSRLGDALTGALQQINQLSADNRMILQLLTETNTYNSYARTAFGLITLYAQEVQRFSSGINNLVKGYLPSELVSFAQLQRVLDETTAALNNIPGDFMLISPHAPSYYTKPNVLYSFFNGSILIQIPAFLRKANQRPMQLFAASTVHVPWNSLNETAPVGDFTQLELDHTYIAVQDHTYALLHDRDIETCISDGPLLICPMKFIYTNRKRPSCLSTLIYQDSLDSIVEYCDFRYFHSFKPPPAILASDDEILLSGFELPFHFRCAQDQQPLRYTGPAFTVIEKSHLCGCDLISHDIFLSAHNIGKCSSTINAFAPKYVINSAIVGIFNNIFNSTELPDVSRLYDANVVPRIHMPALQFTQSDMHDVLFNQSEILQTDLKHLYNTFRDTNEMFLTPNAKFFKDTFSPGMGYSNIILTTLGSLFGALAFFFCCYCIMQRCSMSSALQSVALLTAVPNKVSAFPLSPDNPINLDSILLTAGFHMLVICILTMLVYAARQCLKYVRITRYFLPQIRRLERCKATSDVYCELSDGVNTSLLYVCSLRIHASQVQLRQPLPRNPEMIKYTRQCLNDIIELDWHAARMDLVTLHESLSLPKTLPVPFHGKWTAREITKTAFTVRLFAVSDGLIYTYLGPGPDACYAQWLKSVRTYNSCHYNPHPVTNDDTNTTHDTTIDNIHASGENDDD
jgi:hypothetical protein